MAAAHAIPSAVSTDTWVETVQTVPSAVSTSNWVGAAVSLVLAVVIALSIDRLLSRRGLKLAHAVTRGELRPEIDTRLRFLRRLVYAGILLLGVAGALLQFGGINRLAASLLASGAIAAAIIGFAARQTIANFVAGIMLAVTQPVRVGDWVTLEGQTGVVEDLRLNYTVLRTPADARLLVPNERMASSILRNDTLQTDRVGLDVGLWLPLGADAARAVDALVDETGADVSIAESTPEGVKLSVGGDRIAPAERAAREAELRLRCLRRLQAEGLLDRNPAVQGETSGLH